MMVYDKITKCFKAIILPIFFMGLTLLIPFTGYSMYDGSPDWHAPKKAICMGIPEFPNGMKIQTYEDQVFGRSVDMYIFSKMGGILGLYYFEMALQEPGSNNIEGTVTHLEPTDWTHKEFKIKCNVIEWHNSPSYDQ